MLKRVLSAIMVLLLALLSTTVYGQIFRPVASETVTIEKTDVTADGAIFSTEPKGRQKSREKRPDVIFTGYFSGVSEDREANDSATTSPDDAIEKEVQARKVAVDGPTLAWRTIETTSYHDPFLECGTFTKRIWIDDISNLNGCAACEECFTKKNLAPQFIRQESGGLDVAAADNLLDRNGFIEWMSTRLPVKDPEFVSDKKLIVYPAEDMTAEGRKSLAREVAMAYRRHTWRVIEVQVNSPKGDADPIKSF